MWTWIWSEWKTAKLCKEFYLEAKRKAKGETGKTKFADILTQDDH